MIKIHEIIKNGKKKQKNQTKQIIFSIRRHGHSRDCILLSDEFHRVDRRNIRFIRLSLLSFRERGIR